MAVTYDKRERKYYGLATDTKPILGPSEVGTTFLVKNAITKKIDEIWDWVGDDWYQF